MQTPPDKPVYSHKLIIKLSIKGWAISIWPCDDLVKTYQHTNKLIKNEAFSLNQAQNYGFDLN